MQCKLILAAPLALKFYNRANKFRLPDQLMVGAGNSRHRAARQENRHEGLFLGLTGPWHFYEKKVCSACWSVRFQFFRTVTIAPLHPFKFLRSGYPTWSQGARRRRVMFAVTF